MCLALFCPAGKDVPLGYLEEAFRNNPHGAGFSYFDDKGKVRRQRYMTFREFIEAYEDAKAMYGQQSPFTVHFRYATHGLTAIDNVHPFMYRGDTSVIHNGIIDCIIDDKQMSDTASFVENYLASLPRNWYDNPFLFDMVEQYCAGSKLVILTANPSAMYQAYIVNEKSGHWKNGVWYSNQSYCAYKPLLSKKKSAEVEYELYDQAMLLDDIEYEGIDSCELCGEKSVLDDVCYNCESCQICLMEDDYCTCNYADDIHSMTDEQFKEQMPL